MKYKVGDRVLCHRNSAYNTRIFNKTATIIYIDSDDQRYLLEFDEDINGHDGLSETVKGKDNHCWWVGEECFELIESTHLKFKKGDKVIIKSNECRLSYLCTLECVGTIVDAEYKQYVDDERITYRVRIDNLHNTYQTDGLWVFHEEKSLELCDDAQNDTFEYWLSARTMDKQQYLINKNYGVTRADYPAIDTLHTLSDYIDDCIAQAVLDQPTEETKTFNIKGENEMNKIVELYEERNRGKIYTEYKKKCAKIKLADENYKVYKECLDKLLPIYEKTKQSFHDITEPYLSEETAKKLDELELKKEADLTKLDNELDEIKAQILMCETYEQKQSVLKLYKVIDENGKLNA